MSFDFIQFIKYGGANENPTNFLNALPIWSIFNDFKGESMHRTVLLMFLAFAFGNAANGQSVLSLSDTIQVDPSVRQGKLANGLTYFIRQNKKPEKRAEFRLVVKAGSVLEDDDQQGLAHFVEHMAFNGTEHFPKQDLVNYLERTGVKFGPHLNAYTSFDETVYMLQVPTDSQNVFVTAFQVLEDWAHGISFDKSEMDKERRVVIEEWRLGKGASERVEEIHNPKVFYGSKYALRMPIGLKAVLDTAHLETLKRFYETWYRPDLMSVIVVGDFDVDTVEKNILRHFSGLKNPEPERSRTNYILPNHAETLVSIAKDKELPYPSVNVYFKRDLTDVITVKDYRGSLIQRLYSGMLSNRLDERTQKPNPPFVYGGAGNFSFVGGKQAFGLFAVLRQEALTVGIAGLLEEARRVRQHGFTESELEREKAQVLRFYEKWMNEKDKIESANYADELVRHVVEKETVPGTEVEYEMAKALLPGIALEEVELLTSSRMSTHNRVVTLSLPEKEGLEPPDSSEIVAILNNEDAATKYTDQQTDRPLTEFPAAPGAITKRKTIKKLDVTEWTLSNGARVVFKPTDFKNDEVIFRAFSLGGSSLVSDNADVSASMASQLVMASGLGNYDAIGLDKFLSGKIVRVSPYIGELTEGLSGSASPKDLEVLFQLINAYFTSVRRDSEAIDAVLTKTRSFLQNWKVSPENAFSDTLSALLSQYHHRRRPMTPELLDEVQPDSSFRIFGERFSNASDFTFIFVGNVDAARLEQLSTLYLATLPGTGKKEKYVDLDIQPPKGLVTRVVRRGVEPKSLVQLVFTGPYKDSYKNRFDFTMMTAVLDIKLREILREEKGGVYGVDISGAPTLLPKPGYSINIGFGCDPDRVDELIGETMAQIDSLQRYPLPAIYVEKVKAQKTREREIQLKQNSWWLGILQNSYLLNIDPGQVLDYDESLEKWKAADFQKSVKTYFTGNRVLVILKPEK